MPAGGHWPCAGVGLLLLFQVGLVRARAHIFPREDDLLQIAQGVYEREGVEELNHARPHVDKRFCILDAAYATGELFEQRVRELQTTMREGWGGHLSDIFAYDRGQGVSAMPNMEWASEAACTRYPLLLDADWTCWLGAEDGLLNLHKPFEDVATIVLRPVAVGNKPPPNDTISAERLELERRWLQNGFHDGVFTAAGPYEEGERLVERCRSGMCDCRVYESETPLLCRPNELVAILERHRQQYAHKKGTLTMIVAGKDKPHLHDIVGAATQWLASGWFHRIFFEANTINITGIDTYLKGISDYYMVGREDEFLEAVLAAELDDKPFLALGAWGARVPAGRRAVGVTSRTFDAAELERFIGGVQKDFLADVREGRNDTILPWLHHTSFEPMSYFDKLRRYKFLVAPRGNGIQSPKFLEALMVMTIPVTKRYHCYEQLQQYGMPLVIVDKWSDLTPSLLEHAWQHYKPILERARWIGTNEGVESLYYGRCYD